MYKNIGKFKAYFPDQEHETEDIILKIFDEICEDNNIDELEFDMRTHEIFNFFYKMKSEYPKIFQDIHFNNDPDYPYSENIEQAFSILQENSYIRRPNPSFKKFTYIKSNKKWANYKEKEQENIKQIAIKFRKNFNLNIDGKSRNNIQ